jgi:hypothetical protein
MPASAGKSFARGGSAGSRSMLLTSHTRNLSILAPPLSELTELYPGTCRGQCEVCVSPHPHIGIPHSPSPCILRSSEWVSISTSTSDIDATRGWQRLPEAVLRARKHYATFFLDSRLSLLPGGACTQRRLQSPQPTGSTVMSPCTGAHDAPGIYKASGQGAARFMANIEHTSRARGS